MSSSHNVLKQVWWWNKYSDRLLVFTQLTNMWNKVVTLRPKWNGCHFANIFSYIFLHETIYISIQMSQKFIPKHPIACCWHYVSWGLDVIKQQTTTWTNVDAIWHYQAKMSWRKFNQLKLKLQNFITLCDTLQSLFFGSLYFFFLFFNDNIKQDFS